MPGLQPPNRQPGQGMLLTTPNVDQAVARRQVEERTAINPADRDLSSAAMHLAQVEQTLGAGLDQMTVPAGLVNRLDTELEARRQRREPLEAEWIDAYRRYNNEYDPTTKSRFRPNKSKIWVGLTQAKVHAAHAAIMEMFSDSVWDLEPGRIPRRMTLNPELLAQGVTPEMIKEEIRRRVEELKSDMDEQLEDTDLEEHLDAATLECVITGSGCIKGPITSVDEEVEHQLAYDASGAMTMAAHQRSGFKPELCYVSIFNVYPDMEAAHSHKGNGIFEEMYMTRGELMRLAMHPGFDTIAILRILRDFPNGNLSLRPYQVTLRSLAGDADPQASKRYRVVEYVGPISGMELEQAGVRIPYELRSLEVFATVYYCGQYVLKARLHQGKLPYYIFPYARRTGLGPYGKGIPMLGKSSQDGVNAAARIAMDNAAIASGPLVEANTKLLAPDEDPSDIRGWKVFLSHHDGMHNKRAVSIYDIPAYTPYFMQIIDKFRELMDEEVFLPSVTQGQSSKHQTDTATGMSILNSNANRALKKVMKNIDGYCIEPLVEAWYLWNLRHNPDASILAPAKARASGYAGIVAREIRAQRLMQFTQVFGPHPDFKSTNAMRATARAMELPPDDLIATEEEKAGSVAQDVGGGAGPGGPGAPADQQQPAAPRQPAERQPR